MALTDAPSLRSYLQSKSIPVETITPLSGGTANFVFHITTAQGRDLVVRHAEPHLASAPNIPFPPIRMDFENWILEHMSGFDDRESDVRTPRVDSYNAEAHVLIMSAEGSRTLKEAYGDPHLDIEAVGQRMGTWLARFHKDTAQLQVGDNAAAKAIYRTSYNGFEAVAEKYDLDKDFCRMLHNQHGARLQTDDKGMCYGDFWPGNVLLVDTCTRKDPANLQISIVDWEMVIRGCTATDLGQFIAEATLLDRTYANRGLLRGFLQGYELTGNVTTGWMQRAHVHAGTHLMFWPTRILWGSEEETKKIVNLGYSLAKKAVADEEGWLQGGLEDLIVELHLGAKK